MIQTELYIREITRFLKTVTLKNVYFEDQMQSEWVNDQWRDKLPTNLKPYYRHLAGDYILKDFSEWIAAYRRWDPSTTLSDDEIESIGRSYGLTDTVKIDGIVIKNTAIYTKFDTLVTVWSIDTKTVIPFTKQVLNSKLHHKTASLYRIPNRYYSNICSRYPEEVDLIKAIVYPVKSINTAIDAENYAVLSCDLSLLDTNERTSLYTCMLETLAVIKRRWDVAEFTYEDLYALSMQGKVWSILLLALFKQRVLNIRTSSANKYHVWEYLKSKGLDDYRDVLSKKQAIFLYRNFPYLLRNRGTDRNLILLAHKLLSEWNIVIHSKNLLQQTKTVEHNKTYNMLEDCTPHTVIDSVEIAKSILDTLREIDNNDDAYLLKHRKAADEIEAFDDLANDLQELTIGTVETLEDTYDHERKVGIEYQEDELFEMSKNKQTPLFERTPHTYLPTKLLEITKNTESTLMQQLYARFVTESLLYRLSTGDLEYMISFTPEGNLYPIHLSVAQAIAMIQYCALKEMNLYEPGMMPSTYANLTRPFKVDYAPVPDTYLWRNTPQKTADALRIIPMEIELTNGCEPLINKGVFTLMNPNEDYRTWYWLNEDGVMLTFIDAVSVKYWLLQGETWTMTTQVNVPYSGWMKWEPVWVGEDNIRYIFEFKVKSYEYMIDRYMPTASSFETLDEVMNLIHTQALGYLKIYRELHGSDWARQHSAVYAAINNRTFEGHVDLHLLTDEEGNTISYDEFISSTPDVYDIVYRIENMIADSRPTEYAKLGNTILKTLFASVDSKYLADNAGVTANRFNRLKELFIRLCSYNITFLEGNIGADSNTMTIPGFVNQDIVNVVHGITTFECIQTTTTLGHYIVVNMPTYDEALSFIRNQMKQYTKEHEWSGAIPEDITLNEFIQIIHSFELEFGVNVDLYFAKQNPLTSSTIEEFTRRILMCVSKTTGTNHHIVEKFDPICIIASTGKEVMNTPVRYEQTSNVKIAMGYKHYICGLDSQLMDYKFVPTTDETVVSSKTYYNLINTPVPKQVEVDRFVLDYFNKYHGTNFDTESLNEKIPNDIYVADLFRLIEFYTRTYNVCLSKSTNDNDPLNIYLTGDADRTRITIFEFSSRLHSLTISRKWYVPVELIDNNPNGYYERVSF